MLPLCSSDGKLSNTAVYMLGGCFEYESRKSSRVQIILRSVVTACKICVSVFEEAPSDYKTHITYMFRSISQFENSLQKDAYSNILKITIPKTESIAITSLGEERANLSAFRTFVRFVFVWICRFPLPLGVWEGLG